MYACRIVQLARLSGRRGRHSTIPRQSHGGNPPSTLRRRGRACAALSCHALFGERGGDFRMVSPITGTGTGTAHETHAPVAAPVSVAARPAFRWYVFALLGAGLVAGIAARALAGASAGAFDARGVSAGDTAWVLTAAAFVMLMTPAVGFFYGGMVRSKNVVSVIKQSLLILSIVSLQ